MNLKDVLVSNSSDKYGITIIDGKSDVYISYHDLYSYAERTLFYLTKLGASSGTEILIVIDDIKIFLITFWACIIGGLIPIPVNMGARYDYKNKIFNIIKMLDQAFLITTKEFEQTLLKFSEENNFNNIYKKNLSKLIYSVDIENIIINNFKINKTNNVDISSSDTALVQFSSGSTGDPKGVVLSHKNLLTNINDMIERTSMTSNDSTLSWMPLTHDMGMIGFHLTPLVMGVNQYIMSPQLFILNPNFWLKKIAEYKISFISSPNFGYKHVLKNFDPSKTGNLDLSSVRLIFNGAEPISYHVCDKFLNTFEEYKLKRSAMYPAYGLAEASLAVAFPPPLENINAINIKRTQLSIGSRISIKNDEDQNSVTFVDVGTSLKNVSIQLRNNNNLLLSDNFIGKIFIKGDNVTASYYKNIQATNSIICDGWLDTGDLGFIHKKRLYVTGRSKDIIFISGQNYYSHDLEEIACKNKELKIDIENIVAVGIYNEEKTEDEIIYFLKYPVTQLEKFSNLAIRLIKYINLEYNINIHKVIPVLRIPRTTSGKVQRYILREKYNNNKFSDLINEIEYLIGKKLTHHVIKAPSNEVEKKILIIWKDVLDCKKSIGIDDNYFELGGDSIKAIQIISRLKQLQLNSEVSLLFKFPTIREFASRVKELSCDIDQSKVSGIVPLTPIQNWFFGDLDCPKHHYNHAIMLRVKETLNSDAMKKSCQKIIEHHDALRMRFKDSNKDLIQENRLDVPLVYEEYDLREHHNSQEEFLRIIKNSHESFDLEKGNLIRFASFKLKEGDHFFIVAHHLIVDGVSWRILVEDLETGYRQALSQKELQLPLKTTSFKTYSENLFKKTNSADFEKETLYWRKLNNSRSLPDTGLKQDNKTISSGFSLNMERTNKLLSETNHAYNTSINDILLTALVRAIKKWSREEIITIDLESHGRSELFDGIDLSRTIGWFTSIYPVSFDLSTCDTLEDEIITVKESIREIPNMGIGYGMLKYSENYNNIFKESRPAEILFNYLGQFDADFNTDFFKLITKYSGIDVSMKCNSSYRLNFNSLITNGVFSLTLDSHVYNQTILDKILKIFRDEIIKIIEFTSDKTNLVKGLTLSRESVDIKNSKRIRI